MAAAYALLLLPSPPVPPTLSSLKAAYDQPLTATLTRLARIASECSKVSVLDIALPCSDFCSEEQARNSNAQLYEKVQGLLAGVYSLLAFICSRESIDVSGEFGVDARVLLIDYKCTKIYPADLDFSPKALPACVVELPTLACSHRPWTHLFVTDDEQGEDFYQKFVLRSQGGRDERVVTSYKPQRVPGGHLTHVAEEAPDMQRAQEETGSEVNWSKHYYAVANGGTYDHLHFGHKLLLTMTVFLVKSSSLTSSLFASSEREEPTRRVIIGITDQALLKNKSYREFLENWETRQSRVSAFLKGILDFTPPNTSCAISSFYRDDEGPNGKAVITKYHYPKITIECVAISDPFGPTITDEGLSALVVSGESRQGGNAVNERRKEKGWPALDVFEINVLDAVEFEQNEDTVMNEENFAAKLSSTQIRKGLSEDFDRLPKVGWLAE